jgi:hypothetical protein
MLHRHGDCSGSGALAVRGYVDSLLSGRRKDLP